MLIIKAKNIIPKEKMKNIYETLFKQMQHGLVLVDDSYEISVVEPSMEWIPVSERLPEETGTYITTLDYEKHGLAVGQRYYHGEQIGWDDECVIAWMPLPAPYKVESEENEKGNMQMDI